LLGVERFEGHERLDVRGVTLEHGLKACDGARRIAELVAVHLALTHEGRDRERRIRIGLRLVLELGGDALEVLGQRQQTHEALARGPELAVRSERLLVGGTRLIELLQAILVNFADPERGARLVGGITRARDFGFEEANQLVPARFLTELLLEGA